MIATMIIGIRNLSMNTSSYEKFEMYFTRFKSREISYRICTIKSALEIVYYDSRQFAVIYITVNCYDINKNDEKNYNLLLIE